MTSMNGDKSFVTSCALSNSKIYVYSDVPTYSMPSSEPSEKTSAELGDVPRLVTSEKTHLVLSKVQSVIPSAVPSNQPSALTSQLPSVSESSVTSMMPRLVSSVVPSSVTNDVSTIIQIHLCSDFPSDDPSNATLIQNPMNHQRSH